MEQDAISSALNSVRAQYSRSKARRSFLDDIEGQIEDSEEIADLILKRTVEPQLVAVTADRRWNDHNFSYSYFDTLLLFLTQVAGGSSIYKPVSQLRVLQWHGKEIRFSNNTSLFFEI